MEVLIIVLVIVVVLLTGAATSVRVVKQYEQGVLFRPGKVLGARPPGLRITLPFIDVLHKVSLRVVTMPASLMTTIAELGSFLAGGKAAVGLPAALPAASPPVLVPAVNRTPANGSVLAGPVAEPS